MAPPQATNSEFADRARLAASCEEAFPWLSSPCKSRKLKSKLRGVAVGLKTVGWAFLGVLAVGLAAPAATAGEYAWGAISIDASASSTSPAYGIGGGASESEATENAQKFCKEAGGGKGCKAMVSYQQCGAFASNGHDAGWGKAPTKDKAESNAMNACGKKDCEMVVSDCN